MTTLLNSFEGGTSGTTITTGNSGGASGNAFDVINLGSGATLAFDAAQAAFGTLSCKTATGASATSSAEWSTSMGTLGQVWFRAYLYFTANPTNQHRLFYTRPPGPVPGASPLHRRETPVANRYGDPRYCPRNHPLNAWFRIEGFVTGQRRWGRSNTNCSPRPVRRPRWRQRPRRRTSTPSARSRPPCSARNTTASVGPYWQDDIGISSTGYIGPVVPTTAKLTSVSIVPSLVAAGVI